MFVSFRRVFFALRFALFVYARSTFVSLLLPNILFDSLFHLLSLSLSFCLSHTASPSADVTRTHAHIGKQVAERTTRISGCGESGGREHTVIAL